MTQNPNLAALSAAGVSIWLDDLSRERLRTGNLQQLIDTKCVVGVTTNPTIFQHALSGGHAYDDQVADPRLMADVPPWSAGCDHFSFQPGNLSRSSASLTPRITGGAALVNAIISSVAPPAANELAPFA